MVSPRGSTGVAAETGLWDSLRARVGFVGTLIWGGGAIVRFLFPDQLGGGGPVFELLTVPFALALVVGIARGRSDRSSR